MDGFKPRDGITVFAGTNRVDVLDPALLRAGRFDRHIAVDKPDLRGRVAIAKIYLSKVVVDGNFITGQGPGAAFDFALKMVEVLKGQAVMEQVKEEIHYQ